MVRSTQMVKNHYGCLWAEEICPEGWPQNPPVRFFYPHLWAKHTSKIFHLFNCHRVVAKWMNWLNKWPAAVCYLRKTTILFPTATSPTTKYCDDLARKAAFECSWEQFETVEQSKLWTNGAVLVNSMGRESNKGLLVNCIRSSTCY